MRRAVALFLALVLMGCDTAPEVGTVYSKRYEPAYTWIDYQCMTYDKYGVCKLRLPIVHEEPEHWFLCLRSGEVSGYRYVDQITYHRYRIGEQYP